MHTQALPCCVQGDAHVLATEDIMPGQPSHNLSVSGINKGRRGSLEDMSGARMGRRGSLEDVSGGQVSRRGRYMLASSHNVNSQVYKWSRVVLIVLIAKIHNITALVNRYL